MTTLPGGTIRLRGVGKEYVKYEDTPSLAYGVLSSLRSKSRRSRLWAVRDLDLDVNPGESLAVVGNNGSGKSTLLSMLCGVTGPTTGRLQVAGRIAPLISVGVGFHQELTGRENILVNGTILGLEQREIERRMDEIIDFSGVEAFIDTPVKFYSSGMFVRLGFSVAAHVDPDVLLIDEVLGVGDISFQIKCLEYLKELLSRGSTVIVVSHNMSVLEIYCNRGIVMANGTKTYDGPVTEAVAEYYRQLETSPTEEARRTTDATTVELGALELINYELRAGDGRPASRLEAEDDLVLELVVRAWESINAPFITVAIDNSAGVCVSMSQNLFDPYPSLKPGETATWIFRCRLALATDAYSVRFNVARGNPKTRERARLSDDLAVLVPFRKAQFYLRGRPATLGLVDLGGSFDVLKRTP